MFPDPNKTTASSSSSSPMTERNIRTPIGVLECTVDNITGIGVEMTPLPKKLAPIGSLEFQLSCRKVTCEGKDYFGLYLKCAPKGGFGAETTSIAVSQATGWGQYDVDADLQILRTEEDQCLTLSIIRRRVCNGGSIWGTNNAAELPTLLRPENGFVVNNQLRVIAKIYSVTPCNMSKDQLKMISVPSTPPSLLWESFLESGIGADVTFVAQDESRVKAHSGILIAASPFFKDLLKEALTQKRTSTIKPVDITTGDCINVLLKCLYTCSLAPLYGIKLPMLKEVILTAKKYKLEDLKKGSSTFLLAHCFPKTAVHLVQFAKTHGLRDVEKSLREYIAANIDSVVDNTYVPELAARIDASNTSLSGPMPPEKAYVLENGAFCLRPTK